jgi:hypothetical protein
MCNCGCKKMVDAFPVESSDTVQPVTALKRVPSSMVLRPIPKVELSGTTTLETQRISAPIRIGVSLTKPANRLP